MRSPEHVLIGSAFILLGAISGCVAVAPHPDHYVGVIVKKTTNAMSGYVVSPRSAGGTAWPTSIEVRLTHPSSEPDPTYVWIQFTDPDARIGNEGDAVAFSTRGQLPVDRHVSAEALTHLVVYPRP